MKSALGVAFAISCTRAGADIETGMIDIERSGLAGALLIRPKRHGDTRGWFMETYKESAFAPHLNGARFVQDNAACSAEAGTVRGLHWQVPPHAQGKLVRCVRGRILDAIVDLRRASTTFGRHQTFILSEDDTAQLFVPAGFAHGYATLTANCEVHYKVTAEYHPASERGLRFDDPALAIDWQLGGLSAQVNARDQAWPVFSALSPGDLF